MDVIYSSRDGVVGTHLSNGDKVVVIEQYSNQADSLGLCVGISGNILLAELLFLGGGGPIKDRAKGFNDECIVWNRFKSFP